MSKQPPARRPLPHACLSLGLLVTLGVTGSPAHAGTLNLLQSISLVRTPHCPDTYEICLYSSSGFPMEDTSPALNIGSQTFVISRYVPGNSLDQLVFSLTTAQFLALHNGDAVSVTYNPDPTGPSAAQYSFSALNTPLLPKTAAK